jgi:hypothetical protein
MRRCASGSRPWIVPLPKPRQALPHAPLDAGSCLIGDVDNIAEGFAIIEGELHR